MAAGGGWLKILGVSQRIGRKVGEILNLTNGQAFSGSYMVTIPAKRTGTVRKRRQFCSKEDAEALRR